MSKHRCPNCGAGHKRPVSKCRLCGRDMTGMVEAVRTPKEARRRKESGGLGFIILLGVLAVAVIVLVAVAVDFGRSDPVVRQMPFSPERPDGWVPLEDNEAGFTAELPGAATQETIDYAGSGDGQATAWTASVADEVHITVAYGPLPATDASERRLPVEIGEQWAAATVDGRVREVNETTFRDEPAAEVDLADVAVAGRNGRGRVFAFAHDDRFFTITVETIYIDTPQLSRVVGSLEFDEGDEDDD